MLKLVVILTSMEPFFDLKKARSVLCSDYPNRYQIDFFSTTDMDNDTDIHNSCLEATKEADFIFIKIHGSLSFFKSFKDYYKLIKGKKRFFLYSTIEEETAEVFSDCGIMEEDHRTIFKYYMSAGEKNYINMFKWIGNQFSKGEKVVVHDPIVQKWSGIYDPDMDTSNEENYKKRIVGSGKPVIGVIINVLLLQKENLKHIDALIRQIRKSGAEPLCVYSDLKPDKDLGCEGIKVALENNMLSDGKPIVDSIINTSSFSLTILSEPGDGSKPRESSIFEMFNVPVIQAMTTLMSRNDWETSVKGIDGLSLSFCVFQPEFDGQVIGYPFATTETLDTDFGPKRVSEPIEDRVESIVRLAYNWTVLKRKANKEKKVAIILHNNPPRNDNIGGAAGLDTPASVYNMVKRLEQVGIVTQYDFESGKNIIDIITSGLTNDSRFSSYERMFSKSIDTVSKEQYLGWYDGFSQKVKDNLVKYWEEPVGSFMAYEQKLLVPGILNGNVFIGLQPPRAFEEKAEEMYHSTDIPCPHQYIGFYNWVENIYKADIIYHIGTHGTIEWLPGKEVGLSKNCLSDICIGTVPHLYPYIINAPGEGSQAKRRTYATLIDHMVPSMVESGVYEELGEMDELMKQYYHVKAADPKKMPLISEQIIDLAKKMNLNNDIGLTDEDIMKTPDVAIDRMHSWVTKVQGCDINDGFHIFGMVPTGDRYRNMLKMLVRNRNGNIPSLRKSITELMGYDLEELLEFPERLHENGKTNGILLTEIDDIGRDIFLKLEEINFEESFVSSIIDDVFGVNLASRKSLGMCLSFVCNVVKGKVSKITDEMDSFVSAINAGFIPPGPSGAPTRGNVSILPTGRNFYSVDPGAMPSKASWKTGITLANQLAQRYLKDEEKYPECVSILVYATESMRTYGDDISEILYLLGTRPVWLGNTDRVIGVEVIPLKELGRPRIDVTLRITGLFRDAFPNLIERVEDAVNMVAALDEPEDMNFIKKHVNEEVKQLIEEGMNEAEAKTISLLRIFGDAPGAYGAGVNNVVESKKWKDVTDLGKVYRTWGCHAYGKNVHGDKMPELYSKRMSKVSVAVKNESTREVDMLDSDDFYNYFGGMVAAITTFSGEQKPAYIPSTSDVDHVETLSLHEEASRVLRSKVNNPKWIEGLKKHGYRGAKQISSMVDYAFGWDATTSVIDDWMYDAIANRYVFNEENFKWIKEVNPWAMHSITERLLEANQRGMWNAKEEMVDQLAKIYLQMEGTVEDLG